MADTTTGSNGATRLQELLELVSEGERLFDQHDTMRKRASAVMSKAESVSSPSPMRGPGPQQQAAGHGRNEFYSDDAGGPTSPQYTVMDHQQVERELVPIDSPTAAEFRDDFVSPPRMPEQSTKQQFINTLDRSGTLDFASPTRNLGDVEHVAKHFSGSFQQFLMHRVQSQQCSNSRGAGGVSEQMQQQRVDATNSAKAATARRNQVQEALRAVRPNVACGTWMAPDARRGETTMGAAECRQSSQPEKKLATPLEDPKPPMWCSEPPSPIKSADGSIAASYATPLESSHCSEGGGGGGIGAPAVVGGRSQQHYGRPGRGRQHIV